MGPAIRLGDKEPWYEMVKMILMDIIVKQGVNLVLAVLGLVLVPLTVVLKKKDSWPKHIKKREYEGWEYYNCRITLLNVYVGDVGLAGDGTWDNTDGCPKWIKSTFGTNSFLGNCFWAWRNPVGGYDRVFNIGCKLTEDSQIYYYGDPKVGDDGDGAGRQFVITRTPEGTYRGFYKVTLLKDPTKCRRIRAGYKVKTYYTETYTKPVDATLLSFSTKNYVKPKGE